MFKLHNNRYNVKKKFDRFGNTQSLRIVQLTTRILHVFSVLSSFVATCSAAIS